MTVRHRCFRQFLPPDLAGARIRQRTERADQRRVTREVAQLFNIDEQTLNTQGLVVTTTIDHRPNGRRREGGCMPGPGQDRHACRRGFPRPAQRGGACITVATMPMALTSLKRNWIVVRCLLCWRP